MFVSEIEKLIALVLERIADEQLPLQQVAFQLGMSLGTLKKHLNGGHVRSDSIAKYRRWLSGEAPQSAVDGPVLGRECEEVSTPLANIELASGPRSEHAPFNVVDLFCGCGGMSLGFERLADGSVFRTVMALDIEEPMVRVFNKNHSRNVACQVDLNEFLNEAEVLSFYLSHYAHTRSDANLRNKLVSIGIGRFLRAISVADDLFLRRLNSIRQSEEFIAAYKKCDKDSLKQTSVLSFHNSLKLPPPSSKAAGLGLVIWGGHSLSPNSGAAEEPPASLVEECRRWADAKWAAEVGELTSKANGFGKGQLETSAKKIRQFLDLLDSASFAEIRSAWREWFAQRLAIRRHMFEQVLHFAKISSLYTEKYQVSVLLGGPPCQGFSRIGRGKIRSLRESSVHAQVDGEAGDERNRLMFQYVLFLSALSPKVFLFENVQHFQSEVKTPEGTFQAAEILAECIEQMSITGATYSVASRIVDCSRHGIPQIRQRFFMVGIERHISDFEEGFQVADWALALPSNEPVPLKVALAGLPDPSWAGAADEGGLGNVLVEPTGEPTSMPSKDFLDWVSHGPGGERLASTDAHVARKPRQDDAQVFEWFGPGKRWMDYRCDTAPTLAELRRALETLRHQFSNNGQDVEIRALDGLIAKLNGSLSIRLLLEMVPPLPGEMVHHLAIDTYLKKKDGNHGDWLARLDGERPSKTIVSHMAKDTYAYVHPTQPRTLSVREAARIQTFPDDFSLGGLGLVDGFRVVGNAVPPLLSHKLAKKVAQLLWLGLRARGGAGQRPSVRLGA